jgi:hypothetical protein
MSVFQSSAFQTRLSMRRDLTEGFIVNSVNFGMISSSLDCTWGATRQGRLWEVEKSAMERRVSFRSSSPQPT